jgi:hypothetical protein
MTIAILAFRWRDPDQPESGLQNDCLGATQTIEIVNGWLYKGSHAHDCAYAPGSATPTTAP